LSFPDFELLVLSNLLFVSDSEELFVPTASPLPHHDTCHHSVPPSYTPVRDDLGGVVPPSYSSSHDDLDPDIDSFLFQSL
jgi:hypothetical protein